MVPLQMTDAIDEIAAPPHVLVRELSHTFAGRSNETRALENINLEVGRGEFVVILGPSGSGKSTLLRAIGGIVQPTQGSIRIADRRPEDAKKRKSIGFVFQDPALLPWRTVLANVNLPLEVNRGRLSSSPESLVGLVGLGSFAGYYPHQLSGGMKQRVSLARALAHDPELLLMDEPLGALDEITRGQMRGELQRIWATSQKTVIFVTHSISEAVYLGDRVIVLSRQPGKVKAIVPIGLPRPRDEQIESSAEFTHLVDSLRAIIRD
jgi:NitT/TauT family transport system ATP-binding protein